MVHSFRNQGQEISKLSIFKIWELTYQRAREFSEVIWRVIAELKVGVGETKIVAGSKAHHHLLPELLPPIDREYTIRFFLHHTTLNQGGRLAFMELYPAFHQIALSCREHIESLLGKGMHTSYTKVIDNAIVGFGKESLLEGQGAAREQCPRSYSVPRGVGAIAFPSSPACCSDSLFCLLDGDESRGNLQSHLG